MSDTPANSVTKFDQSRAVEYARQSRIALAGYDACHELSACMVSASLADVRQARILVVGAGGTAGEIIALAGLEPDWSFVAVDPSIPMLEAAQENIAKSGLAARVTCIAGDLSCVAGDAVFDAAIMIGVLHHLPGDAAKRDIMRQLATHLKDGAPLVVAGNYRAYQSQPLFMAAWARRWKMSGAQPDEIRTKMDRILQGAEPPVSEEAVDTLFTQNGFEQPTQFFASLFWGAWISRRRLHP
ncbi:class I SAM-dependent methyltransferase [Agrobacterium sp. AGB01]|uniref:class I SAM-dependent methyltransferase n=1 Tax=Agrobacterium sp. AGB01 TaxID=2769302 RepID=UPI00177B5335|nr:class I SAM-dependent methyltransferase [Agrobacterium sp. AGB01]MBD9390015.1 class I SAM-dependent methyltransferase [Agrobacterium sp. AGB01]